MSIEWIRFFWEGIWNWREKREERMIGSRNEREEEEARICVNACERVKRKYWGRREDLFFEEKKEVEVW
jgi:hypothetical protein